MKFKHLRCSLILKIVHQSPKIFFALLTTGFLLNHFQLVQGADLKFGGYAKNFFVVYHNTGLDWGSLLGLPTPDFLSAVNQRIRSRGFYQPVNWLAAEIAYDLSFRVQDSLLYANIFQISLINPIKYRYDDLNRKLYPAESEYQGSFSLFQNLDRFFLTFRSSLADLYVGRQAIAWGSARVINPTDVVAPFTFDELDKEERIGVDALRLRIPINSLSEFDAGYIVGEAAKFENSAFFTRLKLYQLQSDLSILLLGFRQNLLVGFDLARSIGGAGTWLETAYVFADGLKEGKMDSPQNYFRASAGFDYSFSDNSYAFLEYHFNGAGQMRAKDYLRNLTKIAYQEGAVYLFGKHYLIPGYTYQFTPLISGLFQSLINLTDPSLYLAFSVDYNVAQNVYLMLGTFIGLGESPSGFTFQSEFGGYPDTYFTSFRIYF
jgi:hypothetical protein